MSHWNHTALRARDDARRLHGRLHRHHRKLRSQGGTDDAANIMFVTPEQHAWIHANPEKAYELGWLVKSWQEPAEVPIVDMDALPERDEEIDAWMGDVSAPEPGQTCGVCKRRVPHPRKESSPVTKTVSYRVPVDEHEAHKDVLETAAKFLGVHEQPHWQFKAMSLALALVLQDEDLRGFAQRGAA